jgi:hypothetical protein
MGEERSYFTAARFLNWTLNLNIGLIIVMVLKRDLVNFIITHKKRAETLFVFTMIVLIVFIRGKSSYLSRVYFI